jgi:hypothetical protein
MQRRARSYFEEILPKIEALKERFEVIELGRPTLGGMEYPYIAVRVSGREATLPNIHIHANIHGNEPAGAYAALTFLESDIDKYRQFFNLTVIPSANPSGFELDTRQNANNVDLNRNFMGPDFEPETALSRSFIENENRAYLAVLELHEDKTDEAVAGFDVAGNPTAAYMYEMMPKEESGKSDSLGRRTIERLRGAHVPIWNGNFVYEDPSDRGLIQEGFTLIPGEGIYFDGFIAPRTRYELTFETPTIWELLKRVDAHVLFLNTILEELSKVAVLGNSILEPARKQYF